MKNFIQYIKDTFGKMLFLFIGILGLGYFFAVNDIFDGNGSAGIVALLILTVIYLFLFVNDYKKWKEINKL